MNTKPDAAISILERLVGFETISARPNLEFVDYVAGLLKSHGLEAHISYDETGKRANIHTLIGPSTDGGVVLNGHTDVVPVEGQNWTSDPFELSKRDGRLYGRGAVDMKGFLSCMLASIPVWQQKPLNRPIHISMCYDEEIGGFGAPVLVDNISKTVPRPAIAIIGEPTEMKIITGHKGAYEMTTQFTGVEAHSSDPRNGVSAIHYASRFIGFLDELGQELADKADPAILFDPPYSTFNVGAIKGGSARNILAGYCEVHWELRPASPEEGAAIMARINEYVDEELRLDMRRDYADADIKMITDAEVPGLDPKNAGPATALMHEITGLNSTGVVSFGTDAGHFCKDGISTVVFGPGSIDQAHKPDEYIEIDQVAKCLDFLDKLGDHLSQ